MAKVIETLKRKVIAPVMAGLMTWYSLAPIFSNKAEAVEIKPADTRAEVEDGWTRNGIYDVMTSQNDKMIISKDTHKLSEVRAVLGSLESQLENDVIFKADYAEPYKLFFNSIQDDGKMWEFIKENYTKGVPVTLEIKKGEGTGYISVSNSKRKIIASKLGFDGYTEQEEPKQEEQPSTEEKAPAVPDNKVRNILGIDENKSTSSEKPAETYSKPADDSAFKTAYENFVDKLSAKQKARVLNLSQENLSSKELKKMKVDRSILFGDKGERRNLKYATIDDLLGAEGVPFKDVIANMSPHTTIFEFYKSDANNGYIFLDTLNEGNLAGVHVEIKDGKIASPKALTTNDLKDRLIKYGGSVLMNGQNISHIKNNFNQLRDGDVIMVYDLKGKDKHGTVYFGVVQEKNILKVIPFKKEKTAFAYHVVDSKIKNVTPLNTAQLNTADRARSEIALTNWSDLASEFWEMNGLYVNDDIKDRLVYKFGIQNERDLLTNENSLRKAQIALSKTNSTGRNALFGLGGYTGLNDTYGKWAEWDAFWRIMTNNPGRVNKEISLLTSQSHNEEPSWTRDAIINGFLEQKQRAYSKNPSTNLEMKLILPGQTARLRGNAEIITGLGYVEMLHEKDFRQYDDNNVVIASGTASRDFIAKTGSIDLINNWIIGKNGKLGLLVGGERNITSQRENGELVDYDRAQTRTGIILGYSLPTSTSTGGLLDVSGLVVNQDNTDKDNTDMVQQFQIAYIPSNSNVGGLFVAYKDDFSWDAEAKFLYSKYGQEFLRRAAEINKRKALYNARNTLSNQPTGINPSLEINETIPKGIAISVKKGKGRDQVNTYRAAVEAYSGNFGAELAYEEVGDNKTHRLTGKYAFKQFKAHKALNYLNPVKWYSGLKRKR